MPAGGVPNPPDGVKLPPVLGVVVPGRMIVPGARLGAESAGTKVVGPVRVGGGGTVGVPMIGERIEGIVFAGAGTVGMITPGCVG